MTPTLFSAPRVIAFTAGCEGVWKWCWTGPWSSEVDQMETGAFCEPPNNRGGGGDEITPEDSRGDTIGPPPVLNPCLDALNPITLFRRSCAVVPAEADGDLGCDNEVVLLGGESTARDMRFGLSIDGLGGEDMVGATACALAVIAPMFAVIAVAGNTTFGGEPIGLFESKVTSVHRAINGEMRNQ